MIVSRLSDILRERGLSRRALAQLAGINVNTACAWARSDLLTVDLRVLGALCVALQCQPGDIFVWTQVAPEKKSPPPSQEPKRRPFLLTTPLPP